MVFEAKEHIKIPTKDIISWYFDDPQCDPDKPIYIDALDPSRHYTHRQARSLVRKLVAGFRAQGLETGDVVCIHSFNNIHYPILVNGINAFGGIFAGKQKLEEGAERLILLKISYDDLVKCTNPSYQAYELGHAVRAARIKFFIVEPEILENALKAADENGITRERILIFDGLKDQTVPDGFRSWRTLLDHGEDDWVRFDDLETSKNTTAGHLFSSGTTGLPKAAYISHYNIIAQHVLINEWKPKPYKERRIMCMPMFHVATAPCTHWSPLSNGVETYVLRRFELETWLSTIQRYRITDVASVPPMIVSIIMSDKTKKYDLSSVKFATCGAAPLEKGPQARFQELLSKDAVFTQVWGMTETTCIVTNFPYPEDDDTGSVGRSLPGMDMKLVDDEGKDITDYDTRGELCVRGPTVIGGYLDKEATARSWDSESFFHTGDVAYCARDSGKWYIVDRKKELIKVRGFQVAPPELEAVLLSHPQIVDAAVVGVQPFEGESSEYPRAYVVRRDSQEAKALDAEAVKAFMAERLAQYKRLDGGVVFVNEIPKNPSGKILKRTLREYAAEELKRNHADAKL